MIIPETKERREFLEDPKEEQKCQMPQRGVHRTWKLGLFPVVMEKSQC